MPKQTRKNESRRQKRLPPGISNPVDVHVGQRLRLRRTLLGMSQEKLGDAVGLTFQQIQKYERGTNRVGASRLWEFTQALQVSVDYFFDGYENDRGGKEIPAPDMTFFDNKERQTLIQFYHRIPDAELRKTIVGLIRGLSDSKDNN